MRQKTKQLICEALVRSESIARRMAKIMGNNEIELLVCGIIVSATIKQDKQEDVARHIRNSRVKDFKITKVTGHGSTVQVYYKVINEDGTEGLDVDYRTFDLSHNPDYEELFDLQVL